MCFCILSFRYLSVYFYVYFYFLYYIDRIVCCAFRVSFNMSLPFNIDSALRIAILSWRVF